ncbi:MAG: hypothetical protein K5896_00175 [Prevotella sp.]|nr:hypothetical protein [Prevotella sp.]
MSAIFLAVTMLLTACHSDDSLTPAPPTIEKGRRTVLVYMAAENNLSSYASYDISEMMTGSKQLTDSDRLVIFVDRAVWGETPYLARVADGDTTVVYRYASDFYSSDPERMREVIARVDSMYPAESYGLVLWGHATGWLFTNDSTATPTDGVRLSAPRKAYGQDTGSNTTHSAMSRWMNMPQMARALETLPERLFIFADCCCMMTAEGAYELRHTCRYLIGSPAEIPAEGAPYHLIMPALFSDSPEFYRDIIDIYYDFYEQYHRINNPGLSGYSVPLSCVDMQQMEALAQASRQLVMPPSDVRLDSVAYYFNLDAAVMHDMAHYALRNLPAETCRQWEDVLDRAVPYRRFSARWLSEHANRMYFSRFAGFNDDSYAGLSMFIPLGTYALLGSFDYLGGLRKTEWCYAVGWDRVMAY